MSVIEILVSIVNRIEECLCIRFVYVDGLSYLNGLVLLMCVFVMLRIVSFLVMLRLRMCGGCLNLWN